MEECEDNRAYIRPADQPVLSVPPDGVCIVPSDPQRIYVLADPERILVNEP